MAITDVNELYTTAEAILASVNSVYQEQSGNVRVLPAKQFVTIGGTGEQPHDCEQVTVGVDQYYVGKPGEPAQTGQKCDSPRSAVFIVEIVRQTVIQPGQVRGRLTTEIKTSEQQNANAKWQMQDMVCLLEAGMRVADDGIFNGIADVATGPEMGGYQAIVMTVMMTV